MAFYLKIQTHQDAQSLVVQRWLIEEGQYIDQLRPIVVIRADGEQVTIRAQRDGILLGKYVQDGERFDRDDELATIISPEEAGRIKVARTLTARDREILNSLNRKPKHKHAHADHLRATPAARSLAAQYGISLFDVHGSGPDGRIQKTDVMRFVRAGEEESRDKSQKVLRLAGKDDGGEDASGASSGRMKKVRISPLARKIADGYGIDLKDVKSHGGKIGKEDVLEFLGLLTPEESAALEPAAGSAGFRDEAQTPDAQGASPQVEAVLEEAVMESGPMLDLDRLRHDAQMRDIATLQEAGKAETEERLPAGEDRADQEMDEVDAAAEALRREESRRLFEFFSRIAKDAEGELMAVPTEVEKIRVGREDEASSPGADLPEDEVEEAKILAHEDEMTEEAPEESKEAAQDQAQKEPEEEVREAGVRETPLKADADEDADEEERLMRELLDFARSQPAAPEEAAAEENVSGQAQAPGIQASDAEKLIQVSDEPQAPGEEEPSAPAGDAEDEDDVPGLAGLSADETAGGTSEGTEAESAAEADGRPESPAGTVQETEEGGGQEHPADEPVLFLPPEGEFAFEGLRYNRPDEREALLSASLFDLLGNPETHTIQIPDTDSIIELTGTEPGHALSGQAALSPGPSEAKAQAGTPEVIALPEELPEDAKGRETQSPQGATPGTETGTGEETQDRQSDEHTTGEGEMDELMRALLAMMDSAEAPDMDDFTRRSHFVPSTPALHEDEDVDVSLGYEQADTAEAHRELTYDDLLYGSLENPDGESSRIAMDVLDFMNEELPDAADAPDAGEILGSEILAVLGMSAEQADEALSFRAGLFETAYGNGQEGPEASEGLESSRRDDRTRARDALMSGRPVPADTLAMSGEIRLDAVFSILRALEKDEGHSLSFEPEDFILLAVRRSLMALTGSSLAMLFQDGDQVFDVPESAGSLPAIHEALEACTPGCAQAPVTVVSLLSSPVLTASGAQRTMSPLVITVGGLTAAPGGSHRAQLSLETTTLTVAQARRLISDILTCLDYPSTMLIDKA